MIMINKLIIVYDNKTKIHQQVKIVKYNFAAMKIIEDSKHLSVVSVAQLLRITNLCYSSQLNSYNACITSFHR